MNLCVLKAGSKGPVYIGVATDPRQLIDSLQPGNAYKLIELATIKCEDEKQAKHFESRIHKLCARKRLHGNWFMEDVKIKPAMRRFLQEVSVDKGRKPFHNDAEKQK